MKIGQKSKIDLYRDYYMKLPSKISAYYKLNYDIDINPNTFLRLGLDDLAGTAWRNKIKSPAIHNLKMTELRHVVFNFKVLFDTDKLLEQIIRSNGYRAGTKESIISVEIINKLIKIKYK